MVGLNDALEAFHLSVVGVRGALALLIQPPNGLAAASRLVRVDHAGLLPLLASALRLAREPLGGFWIPGLRKVEVDGVATAVDRTVQIRPFPFDLDACFVHAPGSRKAARATKPAQAPFEFRHAGLHPATDSAAALRDAALFQQFLEVTAADAVSAASPDGPKDNLAPEMSPLEVMGHGRVSKRTARERLPSTATSLTKTSESKLLKQGLLPSPHVAFTSDCPHI